jgi:glycine C-acetyltransferase/8-amino-7-oxononanoate synthase
MTDFSMETPLGPRVVIAGRERDYFSGTGYLGLHNHPQVLRSALETIQRYGMTTGTSRGGYGEHPVYAALEAEARAFFDAPQVLYYTSGYMSGVILAQGLRERCERIFIDDWAHYSLWDGARSTGKPLTSFRHCDPAALADVLRNELRPAERPLVLSDGVFPISGEIAPVGAYQAVLAEYDGAWLCLDDAHATGVLGAHGRGTLEYSGIHHPRMLAGHTLSKAIGGYGGLIAGAPEVVGMLERNSRVYVGASPVPLPVAAAAASALALARDNSLREQLSANVARARSGLRGLGWALDDSPVPIICLGARDGLDLARIKDALFERGVAVSHVRSYSSTPPGGALRIAIFASHTPEQIDRLVETLRSIL